MTNNQDKEKNNLIKSYKQKVRKLLETKQVFGEDLHQSVLDYDEERKLLAHARDRMNLRDS